MSRSKNALKDTFPIQKKKQEGVSWLMKIKPNTLKLGEQYIMMNTCIVDNNKSEHVKEISYLGSQMNQINSISSEIQAWILSRKQCYYAYGNLMKSRALYRSSKLKIYTSLIRPVVTNRCEA
jgi:hypothetical protein